MGLIEVFVMVIFALILLGFLAMGFLVYRDAKRTGVVIHFFGAV